MSRDPDCDLCLERDERDGLRRERNALQARLDAHPPPAAPAAATRGAAMTEPRYDVRTIGWAARDLPEPAALGVTLAEAHAAIDALAARVVTSGQHDTDGALYEIRIRAAR